MAQSTDPAGYTATFDVSDNASLVRAFRIAPPGALIRLAGGNYGDFIVQNRDYGTQRLTIINATTARPVFSAISISNTQGMVIGGVDIRGDRKPLLGIGSGSSDIIVHNCRFYGTTIDNDPWYETAVGVHIRVASSVTLYNNLFQDLKGGMWSQRSSKVVIARNTFRHIREGINMSATERSIITGNHFHSFAPMYHLGEHPDAIQFWTSNETIGNTDIELSSNAMIFGADKAIQGLFLGSELPGVFHEDIRIFNNIYYGSSVHGISLGAVKNGDVHNNAVLGSAWAENQSSAVRSEDGRTSGGFMPGIRARLGENDRIYNNIAMTVPGIDAGSVAYNNYDVWEPVFELGYGWSYALPARSTAATPPVSSFITKVGSPAALANQGVLRAPRVGIATSSTLTSWNSAIALHRM